MKFANSQRKSKTWKIGLISFLAIGSVSSWRSSSIAQITPDKTLGTESSVVENNAIEGGAERGTNLFHSFHQFSVSEGMKAYFNNANSIENIIARVTGNSVSHIDGMIQANGNANLFLLNPNGIVFGPNARLNLGGSFVASTAESLIFHHHTFSTTAPQAPPLLMIHAPLGLQYGAKPKGIVNSSLGLKVQPGTTLALVGGKVEFLNGHILASGANLVFAGLAESGTVGLKVENNQIDLSFPEVTFADLVLGEGATISAVSSNLTIFADSLSVMPDRPENPSFPEFNQEIVRLPQAAINIAKLIDQNLCKAGEGSYFVVTGRGGLPSNPYSALDSNAIQVEWLSLEPEIEVAAIKRRRDSSNPRSVSQLPRTLRNDRFSTPNQIVEAQGWVVSKNGKVSLTARAPNVNPHSSWQEPVECSAG